MNYLNSIFILILSFTILSCAKKDDDSSSTTTELEGNWMTSCYLGSDNFSYISTISVTDTNVEMKDEGHDDSSCTSDNGTLTFNYSSLSIGEAVTFASGASGHKFSMNLASSKYVAETASGVSILNTNSTCGFSDWTLNTEKDITGITCGSVVYPAANTTYLNMYKLVGNNLYIGTFGTTGSYPDSVSNVPAFIKQ